MLNLRYPGRIPMSSFIDLAANRSRVLGPDTTGAYVQVTDLGYVRCRDDERTVVRCMPVPPDRLLTMVRDSDGQIWAPLPDEGAG